MAEYTVRVMRRTAPLLGDKMRVRKLEHDEVTVEATDEDDALAKVIKAEYEEGGSRLRVYVEVDVASGGSRGRGDYALMEVRDEERQQELIEEWTGAYGPPSE
jgi:hypothetical protein